MVSEHEVRETFAAREAVYLELAKVEDEMVALQKELKNYNKDAPLYADCMKRIEEFSPRVLELQRKLTLANFAVECVTVLAQMG